MENPSTKTVYQTLTDQIVAAIEAGAPRFEMPWHRGHPRPVNVASGNRYRGINVLALWVAQEARGYASGTWGTYRQWQAQGAQVRKGERASTVVFYKDVERDEEADGEPGRRAFVAVASGVFNAEQVSGHTAPETGAPVDPVQVLDRVEAFVTATGARVETRGQSACYSPHQDRILMPPRDRFVGSATSSPTEAYYSTLLHELTHWTGHPTRLNRSLKNRFGTEAYAMEELVAELGAAFLCADLAVSLVPRPDHAAYLQGWLTVLKRDTRALFTAASQASAASDHLFTRQPPALNPAV